ncbi:MAG: hypothetical protein ACM3XO_05895 [Bacteroidota bacterium]
MKHHHGCDSFAPFRVRASDHRTGLDGRMLPQHAFHLGWIDLQSATDDQVLEAAALGQVTVWLQVSQVAAFEPAVA